MADFGAGELRSLEAILVGLGPRVANAIQELDPSAPDLAAAFLGAPSKAALLGERLKAVPAEPEEARGGVGGEMEPGRALFWFPALRVGQAIRAVDAQPHLEPVSKSPGPKVAAEIASELISKATILREAIQGAIRRSRVGVNAEILWLTDPEASFADVTPRVRLGAHRLSIGGFEAEGQLTFVVCARGAASKAWYELALTATPSKHSRLFGREALEAFLSEAEAIAREVVTATASIYFECFRSATHRDARAQVVANVTIAAAGVSDARLRDLIRDLAAGAAKASDLVSEDALGKYARELFAPCGLESGGSEPGATRAWHLVTSGSDVGLFHEFARAHEGVDVLAYLGFHFSPRGARGPSDRREPGIALTGSVASLLSERF